MTRRWRRITPEKRRQIIRLARRGDTYRQIADELDISATAVGLVLNPLGGVSRREMWDQGTRWLSLDERIEIRLGLERGDYEPRAAGERRTS
ncbi:MAG TPA: helix-turn-helix domain-containing protein [Actinomycetota bacterium]|nr:helix-turn-helix domain-containing protein [Actinomycetota bacterium]